jgi:hypothetical protein
MRGLRSSSVVAWIWWDSRAVKFELFLLDMKVKTTKFDCHTNHGAQNKPNDDCLGIKTRHSSLPAVTPPNTYLQYCMSGSNMGIPFDSNNLEINPAILSIVTSEAVYYSAR